jgi:hypothetical protein
MPNTTKGWPYPASTDTPDVPRDMKALADKADASLPFAVAAGTVTHTAASAAQTTVAVTFPVGRFTVAPIIQQSVQNNGASSTTYAPRTSAGVTTSGFTSVLNTTAAVSGSTVVGWTAIQMGAAAAAG